MIHTKFEFDLDEDVMSLKDMLHECLGLRRKDIHECSIVKTEDGWTSYNVIVNKALDEQEIAEEFAGCLAIRNIYIDGQPLDIDDADSTTISSEESESETDETTSYSEESDSESEDEEDPFQEIANLFPMLDIATNPPLDPKIAAVIPLLKELMRESRLMIGNSTTGAVAELTGFGPADGGTSLLLYADV
jgi:hypothetical protein